MTEAKWFNFNKYDIDFDNKKIRYWIGRYQGDDCYNYLQLDNDLDFYSQMIAIIREDGANTVRKGIKEILDIKERL